MEKSINHTKRIFWIDNDGWWDWDESLKVIESYLEWVDVSRDEYLIIDEDGYIYDYKESEEGFDGFILFKTNRIREDFISILLRYNEGSKIAALDLGIVKQAKDKSA